MTDHGSGRQVCWLQLWTCVLKTYAYGSFSQQLGPPHMSSIGLGNSKPSSLGVESSQYFGAFGVAPRSLSSSWSLPVFRIPGLGFWSLGLD